MKYPKLRVTESSKQMVSTFKGYNHNLRIGYGEFFDMKNMTSDHYPVLSPRGNRGVYATPTSPNGLITKDALCYVDGTKFVMNEYRVEMGLNDEPKQLISMGAYVIIMPDKKYINTQDLTDHGNIEAFFPGVEAETVRASYEMCKIDGTEYTGAIKSASAPENAENMQLWIDISTTPHVLKQYSKTNAVWSPIATTYIKISAPGIAASFKQYDAVKITGFPKESAQLSEMDGIVYPLWEAHHDPGDKDRAEGTNDFIVIVGLLDEAVTYETELKLERTMPVMDFVIESGNRLYGCHYGVAANGEVVNEIYASKLGDFKNWNCFMQISTDSWVGGVGTDGQFTGAITHMGYPLFFKENCVHKVYGNYPANFQIQTTACRGVQKDCEKSLAIVNETLFYKARSGVCAYDGSLPTEVSYALGNEAYGKAVGGANGNKYYISMADNLGAYHLFVYDVAKGMWHKEDDLKVECFCSCDGEMYAVSNGKIITLLGSGSKDLANVDWMVETGEIGISSPDMKYLSRITIRMSMDLDAEVGIYAQYDFSDEWECQCVLRSTSLRSFSIPIRPKRCDHMKLRIEGVGGAKIYSFTKTIEQGSELS
jgi:hypothetical protein